MSESLDPDHQPARPKRTFQRPNWLRFPAAEDVDDQKLGRFIQGMLCIPLAFCLGTVFWVQHTEIEYREASLYQAEKLTKLMIDKSFSQQSQMMNKDKMIAYQEKKLAEQEEVLASREGFIPMLQSASSAIASAVDKVDTSAQVAEIKNSQEIISAERKDPAVITAHLQVIQEQIDSINSAVAAYDEEQERLRQQSATQHYYGGGGGGGGGSLLERFTRYLRQAGGWQEVVEYDIVCGMWNAIACNHNNGVISISSSLAEYSESWIRFTAYHEHAHTIQISNIWELRYSNWFGPVFGNDLEALADCMAASVLGYVPLSGYGTYCGPDELYYGYEVWHGNVPS